MGIRAHLIEDITYGNMHGFLHDESINEWMIRHGKLDSLNMDGCGVSSFSLADLRQMAEITQDEQIRQEIKEDIAWAEAHKRSCLDYDFS